MRLVIQRVREASVTIDGEKVSAIGAGLFILVGVENGDTEDDAKRPAAKAAGIDTDTNGSRFCSEIADNLAELRFVLRQSSILHIFAVDLMPAR